MSEAFNEDTSDLNISAPYDLPGRYKEIIKNLVRNYIEMWLPEDKTYPNLKTLSESVCNEIINKLFRITFVFRSDLGKLLDEGQEYILKQTKENDESKILMTDENEYDDNQWQVNRMTDTAKRIWSTWKQCVREMPRAGIIPVSISTNYCPLQR
ncbi:unnamed protein product [Didymodactylos carnosus]|uniref:Uncharacterized protein n=1 Tax=Didymodactylos carnosus TaxID=1234261 RepID=A0A813Q7X9_9BILA|nr:unnamed protein product [Didymodactylos carnosus]CAF1228585.1 unnamed protein product [Didymodactylos carnosus]CAF3544411.1 unnamed protein product [Didymodactylos carnosus]CAF4036579.1 unnamed protein product [Didymodactylos carnosus]